MKITEALTNYKNTNNEDTFYREVLSADIKLSEAEIVLKETLGDMFSNTKMMDTFETVMLDDLMDSDTVEVTSEDYE